jgi:TonB family protein
MSIKTFPYRPFGGGDNLLIFVVISISIHILFAFGLLTFKPLAHRSAPREKEPLEVEILQPPQRPKAEKPQPEKTKPRYVVEVPPGPSSPVPPEDFTHYADRNWKVEKETYPEPSRRPALRSVPPPVPGSKSAGNGKEIRKESASPASPAAKATALDQKAEDTYKGLSKTDKPMRETPPANEHVADTGRRGPDTEPGAPSAAAPVRSKDAARAAPVRPNLFPTPERITELEKRYEAEAPRGEKGKTLQLNTSELRYQKYLINMKNRIEFYWEYPAVAARSGWQGVLFISFTIKKDGTVTDIVVGKSSNYPVLDDAAITALRLAVPFPPFPEDFGIEEININGRFEYKIYGGPSQEGG